MLKIDEEGIVSELKGEREMDELFNEALKRQKGYEKGLGYTEGLKEVIVAKLAEHGISSLKVFEQDVQPRKSPIVDDLKKMEQAYIEWIDGRNIDPGKKERCKERVSQYVDICSKGVQGEILSFNEKRTFKGFLSQSAEEINRRERKPQEGTTSAEVHPSHPTPPGR